MTTTLALVAADADADEISSPFTEKKRAEVVSSGRPVLSDAADRATDPG